MGSRDHVCSHFVVRSWIGAGTLQSSPPLSKRLACSKIFVENRCCTSTERPMYIADEASTRGYQQRTTLYPSECHVLLYPPEPCRTTTAGNRPLEGDRATRDGTPPPMARTKDVLHLKAIETQTRYLHCGFRIQVAARDQCGKHRTLKTSLCETPCWSRTEAL